ncbi:MAG: class I SAM-dependent RNA methyltransferase [Actinomycetes bacterium]
MLTIEVGPPVSGGRCLARHDGRVVFVRGALPGESIEARVSGHGRGGAFLWADMVDVLIPSLDRVVPPCPVAGVCGGCDWQHTTLQAQRTIKAAVIIDALRRTGGIDEVAGVALSDAVTVEPMDDGDGFGWRTRMRFATNDAGQLGLRRHESHELIEAAQCPLACEPIRQVTALVPLWPPNCEVEFCSSATGDMAVTMTPTPNAHDERIAELTAELPARISITGLRGDGSVTETAACRNWRVRADGFWQVHPRAAQTLVDTVTDLAQPQPGQHVVDLYAGCGLFSGVLGQAVGAHGQVDAVEGDAAAAQDCRDNLASLPQVTIHHAPVQTWLKSATVAPNALFVLDPPRTGAGLEVVDLVAGRSPRAVIYIACDPVALARDAAGFARHGYQMQRPRSLDMFPMTKHVECVALLVRE